MREEKIFSFMNETNGRLDKIQGSIALISRIMMQLDIQNKVLSDMALKDEESKKEFKKTVETKIKKLDEDMSKTILANKPRDNNSIKQQEPKKEMETSIIKEDGSREEVLKKKS